MKLRIGFHAENDMPVWRAGALGAMASLAVGVSAFPAIAGDDECVIFDELASVDVPISILNYTIELDDSLLYLSTGIREAQVFDISDVTNPALMGGLGVGHHFQLVTDICLQDDIAYLSTIVEGGFFIVDMSDPAAPVTLGQIDGLSLYNVIAVGDLVYSAGPLPGTTNDPGFYIIDVADPSSPTIVSVTGTPGAAYSEAVEVKGNTAYIPAGDAGLIVMDVSDPLNPVMTGSLASLDSTLDVQIIGTRAYIADRDGGLRIADVSDPSSIAVLGGLPTVGAMSQVQVIDNICYATVREGGVFAFDVSDPSAIALVGTIPVINPWMTDLGIEDGVLFTAETNLLRVYSVDDQCSASCESVADMNNDGVLNFFDISIFLNAYVAGDPIADLNHDGALNFHDGSAFLGAYAGGC